ncbi:MAG: hypothetical protein LBE76_06825 [Nitrososphaerota archaeon]|jgi:hypothetical protein|nr:hypothetical protein [Nitrososphaerota archaeon]
MQKNAEFALQVNDMENFKMVSEHFRQDLREFWTRANFFLLAQTALLSAFIAFYPSIIESQKFVAIVASGFGIVLSFYWFFVLRGAVFWIKQWRLQMIKLSESLDRFRCYVEVETLLEKRRLSSPSYLTQYLPLLFVVMWIIMIIIVILC